MASSLGMATSVSDVTMSPKFMINFSASFSFGASNTRTTSYRPSVQYQFRIFIPFCLSPSILWVASAVNGLSGFFLNLLRLTKINAFTSAKTFLGSTLGLANALITICDCKGATTILHSSP